VRDWRTIRVVSTFYTGAGGVGGGFHKRKISGLEANGGFERGGGWWWGESAKTEKEEERE